MTTPANPPPQARWFKWFVFCLILANVGLIIYVLLPRGEEQAPPGDEPGTLETTPATNAAPPKAAALWASRFV